MTNSVPAPLPERFSIPQGLLEEWVRLPNSQEINARFTKQLVEHLFFAISKMGMSQEHLQNCVIHLSAQRMPEANEALLASQRESIEAQNRIRQFLMELIVESKRNPL